MSFSAETKNELSRTAVEKKCCQLAEIAGFLRIAGSLRLAGAGRFRIVCSTDNAAVARHYKKLIKQYFKVDAGLEIERGGALRKGYIYSLTIDPDMKSESILRETGILLVKEGSNYISDGIYQDIVKKKCDRKSYLRGAFLACGSVSDPSKEYHLDFTLEHEQLAHDLRRLIGTFEDLEGKITKRKDKYVVYMKKSEYISDLLALMGADAQVLRFENTRIEKEVVSQAVRLTNCDSANTDRTIMASEKQIAAIRKLKESGKIGILSDKLIEVAELRIEHPEASLVELGEMMDPPLKKSGINNRLKRIVEAAKNV
ncbi:MAG: DNA-binding protein WhiA [Eubacterium sp.]|nr:DNA-binding protein WhiA [Eubacterium sp.]